MRQYISRTRQLTNDLFNRQVADLYRQIDGATVRENVKRLGRLRIARTNGEDLGDIDVLVIEPRRKVLLAVEVKDFELARTPFELSNEVSKLLGAEGSAASHHSERLTFMQANLPRVLQELNLAGRPRDWQVQGLIVTSADLMAAHLPALKKHRRRVRIVAYDSLCDVDANSLVQRGRVNRSTRSDRRRRRR